jgi:hypothetical protein
LVLLVSYAALLFYNYKDYNLRINVGNLKILISLICLFGYLDIGSGKMKVNFVMETFLWPVSKAT